MTYMRSRTGAVSTDYRQGRGGDRHKNPNADRHTVKSDRHRNKSHKTGRYAMPRGLEQKFVAIDGEAFENGYCLLDSSVDDYPRLYSTEPLTFQQIMDWLWGLASRDDCKDVDFILYGADYDFNNWLHDVLRLEHNASVECHDHRCLCRLCAGDYVKTGTQYQVKWIRKYEFCVRKYDHTLKRSWGVSRQIRVWDAAPFFHKPFIDALELYGIDVPQIIQDGKDARGTFQHSQLEWVSLYNHTECTLLISLLDRVKASLNTAHIQISAWNGPGAAAKALIRREGVTLHNGRADKGHSKGRGEYLCPPQVREAMLSAFAGGMMRVFSLGHIDHAWQYDINSAYPYQLCMLPCLTHGEWIYSKKYRPKKFGIWKCEYTNSVPYNPKWIEPFFTRLGGGSYYVQYCHRWMYGCEVDTYTDVRRQCGHPSELSVEEGWYWEPAPCEKPLPWQWVNKDCQTRLNFKKAGITGPALVLKLALNSLFGVLAQTRGSESMDDPSWSQQLLWAGWITASTRMQLWRGAMTKPESVIHLATDGIICTEPLPLKCSKSLGDWDTDELYDLTVVGYGIYFHRDGYKTRGSQMGAYGLGHTQEIAQRIRATWREGKYRTIDYSINGFITAQQVRQGLAPVEQWCDWATQDKILDICHVDANQFEGLSKFFPAEEGLTRIVPTIWALGLHRQKPQSEPYTPKLSKRYNWPTEVEEPLLFDLV